MAKRPTRRPKSARKTRKSARKAARKTRIAAAGPITLTQARAIATVRAPAARAARTVTAAAPPSPAAVGIARKKLHAKQETERKQRIREYTATLRVMKRRGVKGLAPKGGTKARALKAATAPLQVFAEGDSWFDYPKPFFGGGVIDRLENKIGVPILNLAQAGDEVRFMLGVKERKRLIEAFTDGCPAGGPWDAMLFSGGGNDIVDNPMALWIRDYNATLPPAALIHQGRLDAALALVRAGYEDLITLRDSLSPATHLFFHGYDFAIPDGRGVCFLGPWLKPTFDLRGFPTQAAGFEVTKIMLQQFAAMLTTLQASHARITFINGQGTLAPVRSSWDNELHPERAGFNAFATLFHEALKSRFPNRVL